MLGEYVGRRGRAAAPAPMSLLATSVKLIIIINILVFVSSRVMSGTK
jgi:hypothetical protein